MKSDNIPLQRGTCQGCPLSPLLFAICLEPLAHRIRHHPGIQGLRTRSGEHKLSLFADDMTVYVSNPSTSLHHLQTELVRFGEVLGLKVNAVKSEVFPIHVTQEDRQNIEQMFPYRWVTTVWRYLGVRIPTDLSKLLQVNFDPVLSDIRCKLKRWHKGFLPWPDRIHLVKSFVFPKILFPFRTSPIHIPDHTIRTWQKTLSDFLWAYKHHRIASSKMVRPIQLGGSEHPRHFFILRSGAVGASS